MQNRTTLLAALCGIVVLSSFSLALSLPAEAAPQPAAQVNGRIEGENRREKDSEIHTCKEVGLCAQNEKRVLLGSKSPKDVFSALLKGCRAKRWLNDDVVLKCPENTLIAGANEERVFKTQDLFSVSQVNVAVLQEQGTKGTGVRVAILDTGIDASHPEISSRVVEQTSFVVGSSPADGNGHGTHVAGIVAGAGAAVHADELGNNRILGTAPELDLLIVKVCSDSGWCAEGDILAGIEWAVTHGAKVINMSLGGGSFMNHCDFDPLADKANWAANQGVLVVAAAGNGAQTAPGVSTPGCASKAVSVGALDRNNVRQPWSGDGPALDLMAPGLGILSSLPCAVSSTCPEAGFGWWSGTSMAAPHVAGIAALVRGANPALTPDQTRAILAATAYDLGNAGFDESYGFGRVDAYVTVQHARDMDSDGSPLPMDCNDDDAQISPLAPEVCDNQIDDDCDGAVDEGCAPPPASSSSSLAASSAQSSVAAGPVCGNGLLEVGEECEPNLGCPAGVCTSFCTCAASSVSSRSSRPSSSSRSSRAACEEQQKEFMEHVRGFDELRNLWGRMHRCDTNKMEELKRKMEALRLRHPNCSFPFPPPIEQCEKDVVCPIMRPLFANLLRDYEQRRCRNWNQVSGWEKQLFEDVQHQIEDVIEKYPQCGFSVPPLPPCPPSFSSSSSRQNTDDENDDDDEDEDENRPNSTGNRRE
ncbi:MAG TPA: hypothetical protein DEB30_05465 [Candidatus Peribacter riflensis]|uniref:Peptidase S8/S53 domain-containing protein n=1 Tax=Candidatus Peribacter riflensis TaxID=1735162 RepID=A0A0S1SN28_9BACT|nr:MAG: hypothetical protein PeribacterA2_0103 [Candidatus Peribacter riflensis]OGJ76682.1 MAG: hypothetical protein A2398_03555 [Candidatus Peribacteria bacterium RIFOXYB1_FULL_57_12]OGJ78765.1 MAG: hypothetical protein A2412_02270 [Candidatus Peribacteria bacterium RIFOXYC1_FULL_58_8]ALM10601.1 MAG: peptidase S8/S53 subtilisin kexin sedolisin [Candidatus Peribacter riflensis]ALM11703.1 MAG: peptidase S8/S53 subtilisin kexin sedolisin [Candidatus Peribacter riflensis]